MPPEHKHGTNVLLIYPPVRLGFPARYPPTGLLCIASVLEEKGYNVEILDLNVLRPTFDELKEAIKGKQFDVIGIGGMTTVYYYIKLITLFLKLEYPHIPIIGGGSGCSSTPETVLRNTGVDVVVIGEGEQIIADVVGELIGKNNLSHIPGIYYLDSADEIVKTDQRRRLEDLSSLPYPAYHLVDMDIYLANNSEKYTHSEELDRLIKDRHLDSEKANRPFPLYTKRGCPFQCNFCYRNFGRKVVYYEIDSIIDHIKYIEKKFNTIHLVINDELWNCNKKLAMEFCQRIIDDGCKYVFSTGNGLRANLIDADLLAAMKQAGFFRLGVGIESFYNPTLRAMDKKQTADTIFNAVQLVRDAGFKIGTAMMLYGFATDSRKSMEVNVQKLSELGIYYPGFSIPCPYPGTLLYKTAVEKGLIPDEEEWLMELSDRDISDNIINMSNLTTEQILQDIQYGKDKLKLLGLAQTSPRLAAFLLVLQPKLRMFGVDLYGILGALRNMLRGQFPQLRAKTKEQGQEYLREEALNLLPYYVEKYREITILKSEKGEIR